MKRIDRLTPARLIGLVVALAVLAWIGWTAVQKYREVVEPGPSATAPAIPVLTETVQPGPFAVERTWRGEISVDERATLSAQFTAQVEALPHREGQRVEAGETVFRLDDSELRAEIERLDAVLERVSGELETARRELARQRELFERKLTPEKLLDDASQRVDSLSAQLREAEANRSLLATRLDYTVGTAPFAGTIQRLHVERGELARAGSPVLELIADDTLKAEVQVAQADVARLSTGLPVTVRVPSLGREWRARVDRVYPALDPATRNATVAVLLPPRAEGVRVGMSAVVQARISLRDEVLTLPAQAVHSEHGASWVYLAEGERARRVSIDAGESRDGRVLIESGLAPGDTVIVTADPRLRDGAAIRVESEGSEP
ncbi:MAG: efflux RND transporter periplasmic adaptor subunit [Wenzhouxiangella sp.]